jgi:hypothetical protein
MCESQRVPPNPTWKRASCTLENEKMEANVCEVCQHPRNNAVAAQMRALTRAWNAM